MLMYIFKLRCCCCTVSIVILYTSRITLHSPISTIASLVMSEDGRAPASNFATTTSSSSSSSSSRGPSSSNSNVRNKAAPLDRETQRRDIRIFERNMQTSLSGLRGLRLRYQSILFLMIGSSSYWTWRLQQRLMSTNPRTTTQENIRVIGAWVLLGLIPLIIFCLTGMVRKSQVDPTRFVQQLNRSLVQFYVAYSDKSGQLHRVLPHDELSYRNRNRSREDRRSYAH